MEALTAVVQLLALVVVAGGVAKVISPSAFADLLRSACGPTRSPSAGLTRGVARLTGAIEVVLGVAVLATGGALGCLALAACYLVFAVVVVLARRAGAPSCGCFGSVQAPPSTVHVALNLTSAALAGLAAVVGDVAPLLSTLGDQPWAGVPYLVLLGTGTWMIVALDTVGAQVVDALATAAASRTAASRTAAQRSTGPRSPGHAR